MKVLFISTQYPEPADTGKKIVMSGICRYFVERFGTENFILACIDQIPSRPSWHTVFLSPPSNAIKLFNILWYTLLLQRKSLQESFLYSSATTKEIRSLIDKHHPDLLIFDTVRMGQYAGKLPAGREKRILYLEDLFSLRYLRMLETFDLAATYSFDSIATFSRHVPATARRIVQSTQILQRWLLRFEAKFVERSENRQAMIFDAALLVSPTEVEVFQEKVKDATVWTLPPYLELNGIPLKRAWNGEPEFVFLGSLKAPHNAAAIEHFLSKEFDKIRLLIPNVRLRIIGQHASENLVALVSKFGDNVILEGFVDDIRSILQCCCGMLVPLLFGSGIKLKVIDALAAGTPIISTSYGVEGITFENGVHGFLEDRLDYFAKAMLSLLEQELNEKMSLACEQLFKQHYSGSAVRAIYDSYFFVD